MKTIEKNKSFEFYGNFHYATKISQPEKGGFPRSFDITPKMSGQIGSQKKLDVIKRKEKVPF